MPTDQLLIIQRTNIVLGVAATALGGVLWGARGMLGAGIGASLAIANFWAIRRLGLRAVAKVTGAFGRLTLPESLTIAVIVTWSPALWTWTELARTSIEAAVEVVPGGVPVPNGGVPASGPPPPQAAMTAATEAVAIRIFSNLFMQGSLAFVRCGCAQRAAVRSVTTLGVRKISISVLAKDELRVLNKLPR